MRNVMDPCLFGRNILMGWDLMTCTSVYRNLDITEDCQKYDGRILCGMVCICLHVILKVNLGGVRFFVCVCSHSHNN